MASKGEALTQNLLDPEALDNTTSTEGHDSLSKSDKGRISWGRGMGSVRTESLEDSRLATFSTDDGKYTPERIRSKRKLWNQNTWMIGQLARHSIKTFVAILVSHILGLGGWAFPDGGNPTCSVGDPSRNSALCGMVNTIGEGKQTMHLLVSFVLGGFLITTRQLWLVKRSAYCALCGATRNLLINLNTIAPPEERGMLSRWAVLGYELSVLKGRGLIDTKEAKDFLLETNLIVDDEWEHMVNGDRHTTVWYWIQSKAKMLLDGEAINPINFQTICKAVTLSRDKANDLMSPIDRDQPPPYLFVCGLLVSINILFRGTHQALAWAVWMNDAGGWKIWAEPRYYLSIVVLHLYMTILALLFDVCDVMYNPFGPWDIDIPHSVVGSGIRHLAKSLSGTERDCCPPTMTSSAKTALDEISPEGLEALGEMENKSVQGYKRVSRLTRGYIGPLV